MPGHFLQWRGGPVGALGRRAARTMSMKRRRRLCVEPLSVRDMRPTPQDPVLHSRTPWLATFPFDSGGVSHTVRKVILLAKGLHFSLGQQGRVQGSHHPGMTGPLRTDGGLSMPTVMPTKMKMMKSDCRWLQLILSLQTAVHCSYLSCAPLGVNRRGRE